MKTFTTFSIYKLVVFMAVLSSMNAYFLWKVPSVVFYGLCIFSFSLLNTKIVKPVLKPYYLFSIIPLALLAILKVNMFYLITQLLFIITTLQILSLPYAYKQDLFEFCCKGLSYIFGISLFAWIVNLFIFELPTLGIIDFRNSYYFENHLLFLRLTNFTGYYRFVSVFLEPGHVSMFAVFFLFAQKYDFKRWCSWVLLLTILFSLSLAGYVLLVIGFLLNLIIHKKAVAKKVVLFSLLLIGGYLMAGYWGGSENVVDEKILLRLESDEDTGIVGNNRTNDYTNQIFLNFMKTSDCLLGYSLSEYQEREHRGDIQGAGYKIFIFRNGVIGILACFFFYLVLAYKSENRNFMMLFLLLFVVSFIQRAYPYWMAWMLPFLCAQCPRNIVSPKKYKYI